MARYSMATKLEGSFQEVRSKVLEALKSQGFGVLTEIDVQKSLREKIGVEIESYIILGACNPKLAHQALSVDRSIGLLLPCNVVLRDLGGQVEVSILDPEMMFEVADPETRKTLAALPAEAKARLQAVLKALAEG